MGKYRYRMAVVIGVLGLVAAGGCEQSVPSPQPSAVSQAPAGEMTKPSQPAVGDPANSAVPPADSVKPDPAASAKVTMGTVTAVRLINASSGWVGGEGWIARTDDGGKQWVVQHQGKDPISQLFALDGMNAWAVIGISPVESRQSPLLHTTDGGTHWESAGSVPGGAFLHFVTQQEGFAGNAHTTDGGKSWKSLPAPEGIVGSAYFHDSLHGWAVTREKGSIAVKRTVNGGQTWITVMTRSTSEVVDAVIRSAGVDDAWVVCIGGSGMSQTSYSLFHTTDGGTAWQTVIANSTAGAGPAPGFPLEYTKGPHNEGSKPGSLYVVNPKTAFMGGYCPACDNANSVGWTTDGGQTWTNGIDRLPGFAGALLGFADAEHGWWICTDRAEPSVMYVTADGGKHWQKAHTFDKPREQP